MADGLVFDLTPEHDDRIFAVLNRIISGIEDIIDRGGVALGIIDRIAGASLPAISPAPLRAMPIPASTVEAVPAPR